MNKLQTNSFDYSLLDIRTAEFLKRKEKNMREIVGQAYTELGRELYEAQQKLASHNKYEGVFVKWCTHIGFSMKQVYRLIDRYNLLTNCQNNEQKQLLEDLPVSLTYEIAKSSTNEELRQKVLAGEIKTLKEYKKMEHKLKESQQALELAEQKNKELERQLEMERNKKPEVQVVEKTVEKVVDKTDYKKIEQLNKEIQSLQEKVKNSVSQQDYEKLKKELNAKNEELAALTRSQLKIKDRHVIYENASYLARDVGKWMNKLKMDIHERASIEGDKEVHRTIEACIKTLEDAIEEMREWTNIKSGGSIIDAEFTVIT